MCVTVGWTFSAQIEMDYLNFLVPSKEMASYV